MAFNPTLRRPTTVVLSSFFAFYFYWLAFTEFLNFKFYLFLKIMEPSEHLAFLKLEAEGHFLTSRFSSSFKVYSKGLLLAWGCQSNPAKLYWYPTELLLLTCVSISPSFNWVSHGVSSSKVSKFLVSRSCFRSGLNGADC